MTKDVWDFCPTHHLLLTTLRHPRSHHHTLQSLIGEVVDWDRFLRLTRRHQIASLVERTLARQDSVPAPVLGALARRHRRNARQALDQLTALADLLKRFDDIELPVLPMKGPLLSVQLHGDPGLRQCGDLDILVNPDRLQDAEAVLLGAGYRRIFPAQHLSKRQRQAFTAAYQEAAYRHPCQPLTVELHWRWFRNRHVFPLPTDAALDTARTLTVGGLRFRTLDPENLLLYLCAHGARHTWYNLKWLADLPPLLGAGVDTERLLRLARQWDMERILALGLLLTRDLLATPLTPALQSCIDAHQPRVSALAVHARGVMARDQWRDRTLSQKLARVAFLQRLQDRLPYRWQELVGYFSHSEDWHRLPLPDYLFWLYYPLRPLLWLTSRRNNP